MLEGEQRLEGIISRKRKGCFMDCSMLDDLRGRMEPDRNRLDEEWSIQPRLRVLCGDLLAEARKELSEAKLDLEVTEADLDLAIRSDPSKYGLAKATEGSIRSALVSTAVYKMAQKAVIEAQKVVDLMTSLTYAADHRRAALEDFVRLWLGNYYSECRAPEGSREVMDDAVKHNVRQRGNRPCGG